MFTALCRRTGGSEFHRWGEMDQSRFNSAATFEQYLEGVVKNRELWHGVSERVRLPEELVTAARAVSGGWHLVALSEDWCGDAVNTLPIVARFAEEVGWDLRVLSRDENLDLMDAHLTNGRSRSIPVVIVYDENFNEVGWWGPRPSEIQDWVMHEGLAVPSPERYKTVRRWYAKDRGHTTLQELLDVLRKAA
jgi:hypothetical protein